MILSILMYKMSLLHLFFKRANNSGDGKGSHAQTEMHKDDIPTDRILGQASNPNKDEIPGDRGTRRIKGGGRVCDNLILCNKFLV